MDDDEHFSIARAGKKDQGASTQAPRTSVAVSFGSPAGDAGVTRLDLNDVFIRNPQATFLMRISGHSMREAGLDDGDIVLVDRSIAAAHGHMVIAAVDNEFVCRRLTKHGQRFRLAATDPAVLDICPQDGQELQLWGVVTTVIKSLPI